VSTISSTLSAGLQAVTNALPSLTSTPTSVLQNASNSELSSLTSESLQLQQVQQIFGDPSNQDSVSFSEAALSLLAGTTPGSSSANALLQQAQTLSGETSANVPTVTV